MGMKEILFRGKSLNTGEWVYGFVWKLHGKTFIANEKLLDEVDPNTVGQYIGVIHNGVKLFEGDIIKVTDVSALVVGMKSHFRYTASLPSGEEFAESLSLSAVTNILNKRFGNVVINNIHDMNNLL